MATPMAVAYPGSERDSYAYTGLHIFAHALSPLPDTVAKYIVGVKALARFWFLPKLRTLTTAAIADYLRPWWMSM